MFNRTQSSRKISPGKILLIPCLLGVLYWVYPRGENTSITTQLTEVAIRQLVGNNAESLIDSDSETDLANFDLEQLIAHNPFQKTSKVENQEVAESNALQEKRSRDEENDAEIVPQKIEITAILSSGNKKFALIDSELYREGGILPNGMRIAEIHPTHVRLVPLTEGVK